MHQRNSKVEQFLVNADNLCDRLSNFQSKYTPNCKNVVIEKWKKGKSQIGIN